MIDNSENPKISGHRDLLPLLLITGVAVMVTVLYSTSFTSMVEMWQYSDHHHGILVFPIVAYLLWSSRDSLAAVSIKPWGWGICLIGILVAGWLLARAVGIQAAEHLATILLIPATIATLLGLALMRVVMFPLLFMVAAVPIGDALVPHLMVFTADVSAALLRASHVPFLREGQFITLPGGVFEIADVCSGLRYLIAGTMIGLLFAYTTFRSNLRRFIFVSSAAVMLILANGLRAFVVMYVASASDMKYLAGQDHVYFGWLLFGLVMMTLVWVGSRFADKPEKQSMSLEVREPEGRRRSELLPLLVCLIMLALTAQPLQAYVGTIWLAVLLASALLLWFVLVQRRSANSGPSGVTSREASSRTKMSSVVVIFLAMSLLGAGPLLGKQSAIRGVTNAVSVAFPAIDDCGTPGNWILDWEPRFLAPDYSRSATYICGGQSVSTFVAGYSQNTQGSELVTENNLLIPDEWRRFSITRRGSFATGDGKSVHINEILVGRDEPEFLVWYWYAVGDSTATGAIGVKLLQALQLIFEGREDGRVYLLQTSVGSSVESGQALLAGVAKALDAAMTEVSAANSPGIEAQ